MPVPIVSRNASGTPRAQRTCVGATTRYTPRAQSRGGSHGSSAAMLSRPATQQGGTGRSLSPDKRPVTAVHEYHDAVTSGVLSGSLERREGPFTFRPSVDAPPNRPWTAADYFAASPTSRGGRAFVEALPPAPKTPPSFTETLPQRPTYFGSPLGAIAPRSSPPRSSFSPPLPPPDEPVENEFELQVEQMLRRVRAKIKHKYGEWQAGESHPPNFRFTVHGSLMDGSHEVNKKELETVLHHRKIKLDGEELELLFGAMGFGAGVDRVPFSRFARMAEGATGEQVREADRQAEAAKRKVHAVLEEANGWPFAQMLRKRIHDRPEIGLNGFFKLFNANDDGKIDEGEMQHALGGGGYALLPSIDGVQEQVSALFEQLRAAVRPHGVNEGIDFVGFRKLFDAPEREGLQPEDMTFPKTHVQDTKGMLRRTAQMDDEQSDFVASLDDWQRELLPPLVGEAHVTMVREAAAVPPLAETWNSYRAAHEAAIDGTFSGGFDGIGAMSNTSSAFGGLAPLGSPNRRNLRASSSGFGAMGQSLASRDSGSAHAELMPGGSPTHRRRFGSPPTRSETPPRAFSPDGKPTLAVTKRCMHGSQSTPSFGTRSEVGALAAREKDTQRLHTHASSPSPPLNVMETQQMLVKQPCRRMVLARNKLQHSNLTDCTPDSPMFLSDDERMTTTSLTGQPTGSATMPAARDKHRRNVVAAVKSTRRATLEGILSDRALAADIKKELRHSATALAKARQQLWVLDKNPSAMLTQTLCHRAEPSAEALAMFGSVGLW